MTLALLLTLVPAQPGPFSAPPVEEECWVQPLQVSISELAMMGQIADRVVRNHCSNWLDRSAVHLPKHGSVVAKSRIASFTLFGEQLSFGFDVVMRPGTPGGPDSVYAVTAWDLPEAWERAIDTATYPVLAIGGTAIITAVIIKLAGGK